MLLAPVRQSGLLRRTGPLRQAVLSRHAGRTRRIIPVRILQALNSALGDDLAADALRGVDLTHDTAVAQRLLRRDDKRQGGKAPACAGPYRKAARALGEKAKPGAGAVVDGAAPPPAISITSPASAR